MFTVPESHHHPIRNRAVCLLPNVHMLMLISCRESRIRIPFGNLHQDKTISVVSPLRSERLPVWRYIAFFKTSRIRRSQPLAFGACVPRQMSFFKASGSAGGNTAVMHSGLNLLLCFIGSEVIVKYGCQLGRASASVFVPQKPYLLRGVQTERNQPIAAFPSAQDAVAFQGRPNLRTGRSQAEFLIKFPYEVPHRHLRVPAPQIFKMFRRIFYPFTPQQTPPEDPTFWPDF